jgi:hypothetical protein
MRVVEERVCRDRPRPGQSGDHGRIHVMRGRERLRAFSLLASERARNGGAE